MEHTGTELTPKKGGEKRGVLTPLKAIRAKCLDCSGNSQKYARECHIQDCSLWRYRMGHRPRREERAWGEAGEGRQ